MERSFAHCYDTGGMRRTHLSQHDNILKRQLIHVGAFNLGVSFRFDQAYAKAHNVQMEILRTDEGGYAGGEWTTARIWNGDQTDRGLNFRAGNRSVERIRLQALPQNVK